jgi:hypothetical protein
VIKANSPDSIKKWTVLKQVLKTGFLYSLVTGERKCPVVTFANPNGYTANIIFKDPTTGEATIIKKNDLMLYQHDFVRAYQLVHAMFGDCLLYLISKEIKPVIQSGYSESWTSTYSAIKPGICSSIATL